MPNIPIQSFLRDIYTYITEATEGGDYILEILCNTAV